MSVKQTRKSISISGELYTALRSEAEARSVSGAGMVESVMRKYLGLPQAAHVRKLNAPRPMGRPVTKLKTKTAPQSDAVEVTKTEVHVAVDPEKQLKLDRAKEFEKWEENLTEEQRRAASVFTF